MQRSIFGLALVFLAAGVRAADRLPVEEEVAAVAKGEKVTVVHFWAPWCSNCYGEIAKPDGWGKFITTNPDVNVVFVTSWNGGQGDGKALLEKNGVGRQPNFRLFLHPNGERSDAARMRTFLGHEVNWLPATWVFRAGKLRYALNYGEVRFSILQQLVKDAAEKWE